MAKKQKHQAGSWWAEAEEIPRAGTPRAKKLSRRALWLRVWVWCSVVMFPLTAMAYLGEATSGSPASAQTGTDAYADTRPTALLAVETWLAGEPEPLPGGRVLSWDSAETVTSYTPKAEAPENDEPYDLERHVVTLASGEATFTAEVLIAVSDDHGARPVADPFLAAAVPADDSWTPDEYPGLDTAAPSDAVRTAVTTWAAAYTSEDPTVLAQAVGDPDDSHGYVPLIDAVLDEVSITDAYAVEEDKDTGEVTRAFARVTATISWPTLAEEDSESTSGSTEASKVAFDVLVEGWDSGAPRVVAWGGPGTGATLKPYANAVEGRAFTSAEPLPIPSTTASPAADTDTEDDAAASAEDEPDHAPATGQDSAPVEEAGN